jgi:hypothetical protein
MNHIRDDRCPYLRVKTTGISRKKLSVSRLSTPVSELGSCNSINAKKSYLFRLDIPNCRARQRSAKNHEKNGQLHMVFLEHRLAWSLGRNCCIVGGNASDLCLNWLHHGLQTIMNRFKLVVQFLAG